MIVPVKKELGLALKGKNQKNVVEDLEVKMNYFFCCSCHQLNAASKSYLNFFPSRHGMRKLFWK